MILTTEERAKFAQYLRQDIESTKLVLSGLEKVRIPPGILTRMKEIKEAEIKAEEIVARMLENTEGG